MKRRYVWLCMSVSGFSYWGVVHGFASNQIDHFTGPAWFGGMSLLAHWLTNHTSLSKE